MLDDLADQVNTNEPLVHRGRWVNLTFTLGIGEDDYLITVERGRITDVKPRPLATRSGVARLEPPLRERGSGLWS